MSIKVNTFWNSVDKDVESNKYTRNLIFEKNIYLDENVDYNDETNYVNVLIIGFSPHWI